MPSARAPVDALLLVLAAVGASAACLPDALTVSGTSAGASSATTSGAGGATSTGDGAGGGHGGATTTGAGGGTTIGGGGGTTTGAGGGGTTTGAGGAPCGGAMCGGSCVDLATNGANCGACGHDCLGGGCVGGRCQAVAIAENVPGPFAIAVDDAEVFFTSSAGVLKCPKSGCGGFPVKLASCTGDWACGAIALVGDDVYFGTEGGLARCAKAGCNQAHTLVAPDQSQISAIVADAQNLYFTRGNVAGTVMKCALGACTPTPMATGVDFPGALAVDATHAYWVDGDNHVTKAPIAGGAPTDLVTDTYMLRDGLALANGHAYWTNSNGDVARCPVGGCASPETLVTFPCDASGLVVDATHLYFTKTCGGGGVARCPIGGCAKPEELMTELSLNLPRRIAQDAVSIYVAVINNDAVYRLAK
jgi:hypothetical protein